MAGKREKVSHVGDLQADGGPKRGIAPRILLGYVRTTAPFLFESHRAQALAQKNAPHLGLLIATEHTLAAAPDADLPLAHAAYFRLCLAAHHATVASYVPTDVDNQIRFKLWDPALPLDDTRAMAAVVEDSLDWDCRFVSTRWIRSPLDDGLLSGHLGEWFSTAVAAYAALRKKDPGYAARLGALIGEQMVRQARIFSACIKRGDGVNTLKSATILAHNLGDFDRVCDAWALSDDDPLKMRWYKAGHIKGPEPALAQAGDLNKAMMAIHSHRHFPLREPKALRSSPDLLLPLNPFLDDWGQTVGSGKLLAPEDIGEVVVALVHGFFKLQDPGYARALAGIEQTFPGGFTRLDHYVPARIMRDLKSGELRTLCSVPQRRFEEQIGHKALRNAEALGGKR